jgi:hypothetical protein
LERAAIQNEAPHPVHEIRWNQPLCKRRNFLEVLKTDVLKRKFTPRLERPRFCGHVIRAARPVDNTLVSGRCAGTSIHVARQDFLTLQSLIANALEYIILGNESTDEMMINLF